jgi:hypothetical protein
MTIAEIVLSIFAKLADLIATAFNTSAKDAEEAKAALEAIDAALTLEQQGRRERTKAWRDANDALIEAHFEHPTGETYASVVAKELRRMSVAEEKAKMERGDPTLVPGGEDELK